jgi:hypothetical protein
MPVLQKLLESVVFDAFPTNHVAFVPILFLPSHSVAMQGHIPYFLVLTFRGHSC